MTTDEKINKIIFLNQEMFPENAILSSDAIQRIIAQVVEELGEIHGAVRSYFGRRYSPEKKSTIDHISEEIGDTITMVLLIGCLFNIPLKDSLDRTIQKLEILKVKKQEEIYRKYLINQGEDPTNIGTSYNALLFGAEKHQPLKYDLEDPINKHYEN